MKLRRFAIQDLIIVIPQDATITTKEIFLRLVEDPVNLACFVQLELRGKNPVHLVFFALSTQRSLVHALPDIIVLYLKARLLLLMVMKPALAHAQQDFIVQLGQKFR